MIAEAQLCALVPMAATVQPGYSRRVEIVYDRGKTSPLWEGVSGDGVHGRLQVATVRDLTRHLFARVMVDVDACVRVAAAGSISLDSGRAGPRKATLDEARQSVARTLAHECVHCVQAWKRGGDGRLRDDMGYLRTRLLANGVPEAGLYHRDWIEQEAFRNERLDRGNQQAVGAGRFDAVLPIEMIRAAVA
ncbi:MAG: hypothetical protein IPK81_06690 [Rhodospirillales bacterium]|nr:MAG: hypothetical protein IPK81_06690 [Rhodospirillales bacterium]